MAQELTEPVRMQVGMRTAAIYSLIETAKANGLDPEAYLRHVINRNADHPVSVSLEE
jgi:IS66 C-terminal element